MRIGRTLPPAASPILLSDITNSIIHLFDYKITERFAEEIKNHFQAKYCYFVSSGKAALYIILLALKELYPDKNEVLIPAFSCFSVPAVIKNAGLKIKLCDIDPDTLDFDFNKLAQSIDWAASPPFSKNFSGDHSKILCVLSAHLYGIPANIEKLRGVTRSKLLIIEDAAQTFGSESNGIKLGTQGDIGFFSLGRGKSFSTLEGGIIITNRDEIGHLILKYMEIATSYNKLDLVKVIAQTVALSILLHPTLFWLPSAFPFLKLGETIFEQKFPIKKMSLFQIALATKWQYRLNDMQRIRRHNTNKFREQINQKLYHYYEIKKNNNIDIIRYPIRASNQELRSAILTKSKHNGLGIMPSYPKTINEINEIKNDHLGTHFPGAKLLSECLMTLPVHPYINENDIDIICKILNTNV